jgi:multidrug efflux pump subunit AcrB
MNLAAFAVRYRPIVVTLVTLLMAWGTVSFFTIPRREDPEYTVRTCAISTAWPGATAQKVEELITKPIEEAIDRINDVDVVYSTTTTGLSTVFVDAEDSVTPETIDNVWDKVRAYVARVNMPEQGIVPVINDEYGDTSIILFSVYQTPLEGEKKVDPRNEYSLRELDIISEDIKDELRLLDGVAKVDRYGVIDEAIYIETDLGTWSQLDLTTAQLENLVEARNIVAPGGNIDTPLGRMAVKPGGELNAVDELNSIIVAKTSDEDPRPVYLRDLGLDVRRGYDDPRKIFTRFTDANSSRPCIMLALSMKSGGNIVTVCNAAKNRIEELHEYEQAIPPDIAITPISDSSINVTLKIGQVLSNVVGAIVIVVIVVYLVVGFRSAAVMAANIPVVVLSTIALITLFDVQLEQISLASIIIALGLLVDNAVQVCDQSRTNQIDGMDPVEATVSGSTALATPMLMGTATTIAAFAPMLVGLKGNTAEYVYSLPVTLSITLAISWVLAMTFCSLLAITFVRAPADPNKPSAPLPMLLAWLQSLLNRRKKKPAKENDSDLIDALFRKVVSAAIDFKFVTVGVAVGLFVLTMMLPVTSEFFPKDMRDQFAIRIWLPENVGIEQTNQVAKQVEELLQRLNPVRDSEGKPVLSEDGEPLERLRSTRTIVGGGGSRWYLSWNPEPRSANFAEILVRTTDARFTEELARRVREVAENGDEGLGLMPIAGARIVPVELFLGPSDSPVKIRVIGSGFADLDTLRGYADRVKNMVSDVDGTWDTTDSWGVPGFQLKVDVDEDKANLAGVSNVQIAQSLNAYYSGHHLTTFREGDHLVPVYFRLDSEQRNSLDGLRTLFVEGTNGKIPLNSIATVEPRWEPAKIGRRDLNRVIEVISEVESGVSGNDVTKRVMASEEMQQLQAEMPSGYRVEVGGNLEKSNESAVDLAVCLGISIMSIILLLVIQYNGWAKPIIILSTLPLSLVGALPGLWLTDNALGFMPQLGILSLFGIVLNTGIIFIEFADQVIKRKAESSDGSGPIHGLTKGEFRECLVEAGKQRLLPIFLTTATTIGGLVPLAISGGPLWEGMAWSMIFGLIVATVLTLIVIPSLYAIFVEHFGVRVFNEPEETQTQASSA